MKTRLNVIGFNLLSSPLPIGGKFFDTTKLAAFKAAVDFAGDPTNPRYTPNFQTLTDAFEPFSIDGYKASLEKGGLVGGSEVELEFYKNFIIIMKSSLSLPLFNTLKVVIDSLITARVDFLKDRIARHPSIVAIDAELGKLRGVETPVPVASVTRPIVNKVSLTISTDLGAGGTGQTAVTAAIAATTSLTIQYFAAAIVAALAGDATHAATTGAAQTPQANVIAAAVAANGAAALPLSAADEKTATDIGENVYMAMNAAIAAASAIPGADAHDIETAGAIAGAKAAEAYGANEAIAAAAIAAYRTAEAAIADPTPTNITAATQIATVNAIDGIEQYRVERVCNEVELGLRAYLRPLSPSSPKTIDCAPIIKEVLRAYKEDRGKILFQVGALKAAKSSIEQRVDDLNAIYQNVRPVEDVSLTILGDTKSYPLLKGETDIKRIVAEINANYLLPTPGVQIDLNNLTDFPTTYAYDNKTLTTAVANFLQNSQKINIGDSSNPNFVFMHYSKVVDRYSDDLYPSITPKEISDLDAKIGLLNSKGIRTSSDPLAELYVVLTSDAVRKIRAPFSAPAESERIKNMRDTFLSSVVTSTGEKVGLIDLVNAIKDVENAVDDVSSGIAITNLASFFANNPPPLDYKTQLITAAALPGIDFSTDFGLTGQLGVIQTKVLANPHYLALTKVANINKAKLYEVLINPDPAKAGESMVERAGPNAAGPAVYDVPLSLRRVIFGRSAGNIIVVDEFDDLKRELDLSLKELKVQALAQGVALPITHQLVQPIVNAFDMLFREPIEELLKLNFDGTDDPAIATIFARINVNYAERFDRFKSVVGENHKISGIKREIFKLLEGYTDSTGKVHLGLKAKFTLGSTSIETKEIERLVNMFLQ